MSRVFLLNPPSSEPVQSPLLSLAHLAANLRMAGHSVGILDAAAPFAPSDLPGILGAIRSFAPDLLGLHLKTLDVQRAYRLVAALREDLGSAVPLVAGGPHGTVCPEEPLRWGFDYVIQGEAELSLALLASALENGDPLDHISGLSFPREGQVVHAAGTTVIQRLDALPSALDAMDLFSPAWYRAPDDERGLLARVAPAGLLTSRGCPAHCTFCCNNVTGRRFRFHDAERVAAEVLRLKQEFETPAFVFFDDSFAVGRRRVQALCEALVRQVPDIHWTCTAHPNHLHQPVLEQMRLAGCGGIDIGMESAYPPRLKQIGKGLALERVEQVLGWTSALGIHTVVNQMYGWPEETAAEVEASLAFMEQVAPLAGGFNARGVLIPLPGTEIYEKHHEAYGFTQWWLREEPLPPVPWPERWADEDYLRVYAHDPALERNFFGHSQEHLDLIQQALDAKASWTLAAIKRMRGYTP